MPSFEALLKEKIAISALLVEKVEVSALLRSKVELTALLDITTTIDNALNALVSSSSAITVSLVTESALVGAASSSSSIGCVLDIGTYDLELQATVLSSSSIEAAIATASALEAELVSVSSVAAELEVVSSMLAELTSASTISAELATESALAAAVESASSISAAIATEVAVTGTVTSASSIACELSAGSSYLLDGLTNFPVCAWALRLLTNTYSGDILRIRRTYDDEECDVGFDSNDILSLNSPVSNFSSGSDASTLGEFVAASGYTDADSLGSADSAYVKTWYNQGSGGSTYDLTQTNSGNQPRIVNAGVIETKNSKPSLYFDGGDKLDTIYTQLSPTAYSWHVITSLLSDSAGYAGCIQILDSSTNRLRHNRSGGGQWIRVEVNGGIYYDHSITYDTLYSLFTTVSTDEDDDCIVSMNASTSTPNSVAAVSHTSLRLGYTDRHWKGQISEFIFFNADARDDRSALETDLMTYHGIS
jgi:hypothetical protein